MSGGVVNLRLPSVTRLRRSVTAAKDPNALFPRTTLSLDLGVLYIQAEAWLRAQCRKANGQVLGGRMLRTTQRMKLASVLAKLGSSHLVGRVLIEAHMVSDPCALLPKVCKTRFWKTVGGSIAAKRQGLTF